MKTHKNEAIEGGNKVLSVFLVPLVLLLLGMKNASAGVILQVDSTTGKLLGAEDVMIGGQSYDVAFREGSCNGLFGGCDPTSFDFTTESSARIASEALLDQVLRDGDAGQFDSDASDTFGCDADRCWAMTPYQLLGNVTGSVFVASALNYDLGGDPDMVTSGGVVQNSFDTANDLRYVWADWTLQSNEVPEPGTLFMLGAGLFGFLARRRLTGEPWGDDRSGTARPRRGGGQAAFAGKPDSAGA